MSEGFDPRDAARFLRTLRVASQTALAQDDLRRGRANERPSAGFLALAAKGPQEWRFPAAGLLSSDGLVLAHLLHENEGARVIALQAQGLAGLSAYAGRSARIRFGEHLALDGMFDRDGRLHLVVEESAIDEIDLSAFDLELLDASK
jgi:hypothetical protein